jgi:galactokinase
MMITTVDSETVREKFAHLFKSEPVVVRSPGRVNIIGEHTDYNDGFVLPAAIDKSVSVAIDKRDDGEVHLYSEEFNESFITSISDIQPVKGWPAYVLGVVDQLTKSRYSLQGFNMVLSGDVPIGAGLSSSAAVECATLFAINDLFGLSLSRTEMAGIAQKAEHEFAGVRCGIMDQFASLFGKKDFAIKLDCRSLEYEYIPLKLNNYKIVLFNTNVKHSLAASEYNTRRAQCEQGVEWIRVKYPNVRSLRDTTTDMLDKIVFEKDQAVYRKCRYVVEENLRLLAACEDLKNGDLYALGEKMFRTHKGLSQEYEVSCKELDFLVDAVSNDEAVIGARMMGGGFGGCTINLIREDAIERLSDTLSKHYKSATGLDLSVYIANTENGTHVL